MDKDTLAQLQLITNQLLERAALASRFGKTFANSAGKTLRDLYLTLGYPADIAIDDYRARFERQEIAQRVLEAPVEESWRLSPDIVEDAKAQNQTPFEEAWDALQRSLHIWTVIERADLLSGVGRFGVLFLGLNDGKPINQEATDADQLLYLQPYGEDRATVKTFVTDPKSPRFGLPEIYQINVNTNPSATSSSTKEIHWSRIIHLAEGVMEDEVYGRPRLKSVYNRLLDVEEIAGGSTEGFWRGAIPGLSLNADPDVDFSQTKAQFEDEIKNYLHGLQRYLRLQGVEATQLAPQVADPTAHLEVQLMLISAGTRIPKRILVGSERGELASSQDEDNWSRYLDRRRERYLSPRVIRPFVDRLISFGVLKEADYQVDWPPLQNPSAEQQASVGKVKTETIAAYAAVPGIEVVFPLEMFWKHILQLDQDQIDTATKLSAEAAEEEKRQMEEEARIAAEEAAKNRPPTNPKATS